MHTSVSATRSQRGFTLTELLVALAIVGILTSVALPLYTAYQLRGYRSQAMADLGDCAQALERGYTVNYSYAGQAAAGADTGAPVATLCTAVSPPQGTARYNITIQAANANAFTLRATPIATAGSAGDGFLELDASGARRWDKNNDGDATDTGEDNWEE